jgi:hypothetical protein
MKPSDFFTVSLCRAHHAEQHWIGEEAFERRYGVNLKELAAAFADRSPHRYKWRDLRHTKILPMAAAGEASRDASS